MSRAALPLLAALLVALAQPADAAGQTLADAADTDTAGSRSGVHFSLGLGAGSVSASCAECAVDLFSDRLTGVSGVLQLGFFANPRLAVAGEFIGWVKNDHPIYRRVAGLGVSFIGYPSASNGFFLKGTIGGLRAIVEDDVFIAQTDAWMATTGIGYDIPVGSSVALTAYANYVRTFGGATMLNSLTSDVVLTPDALQLGVGLTVH